MEPLEYLRVLRRRWRLVAACILVAGVGAWVTTPANPSNDSQTFAATHTLIRDSQPTAQPQALPTVALYVKTGAVPERVADRIGFRGEPALLAARVSLLPDEQVSTLEITTTGPSRREAADLANAFAEETLSFLGAQAQEARQGQIEQANERVTELQVEIDDLEDQINAAQANGQPTATLQAERDSRIRQYGAALDQQQQALGAAPPTAGYLTLQEALPELAKLEGGGFAAPTSRTARGSLAMVVGLLLGLGAVVVAERLDTKVRTREGVEDAFGLPVVTEIPVVDQAGGHRILTDIDPLSAAAESYRTLRASLLLTTATPLGRRGSTQGPISDEPQVILVTSSAPGEGKTTTVANLAAAFAETGRSVLVLGCDFRRPEIHKHFDVPDRPGLSEVLGGRGRTRLHDVIRATTISGVFVAPSGPGLKSLGDLASTGRDLIRDARGMADVVLIDTAPILATNEASELIPSSDAVVVVSRLGRTTVDGARRTRTLLDRLGSTVSGVAMIGGGDGKSSYSGYYTSSTISPGRRAVIPLRRTLRSDEIEDRISSWRGSDPTGGTAAPGATLDPLPPREG